jgi:hypothetical protein
LSEDESEITFTVANGKFETNTNVEIWNTAGGDGVSQGGTKVQEIYFHTSCSKPLSVGDIFGAVVVVC